MEFEPFEEVTHDLRPVLPPAPSEAGGIILRSVEDLLSPQVQAQLSSDLAEMAKLRRQAEDAADQIIIF